MSVTDELVPPNLTDAEIREAVHQFELATGTLQISVASETWSIEKEGVRNKALARLLHLIAQREAAAKREAHGLPELQSEIGEWGDETFPNATLESVRAHFDEEAAELHDSSNPVDLREETADCAMLLIQIAHHAGFDLDQAIRDKLEINRKRTWGQVAGGYSKHIDAMLAEDTADE